MNRSKFSPPIGALLGLIGYFVGALLLMSSGSPEAAGAFFFFALVGLLPALVFGAYFGGIFGKRRLLTGGFAGLVAGFVLPFIAFYAVTLYTGAQSQMRRKAYEAESNSALTEAKSRGFIFPTDAKAGMVGQAWSKASLSDVRNFYHQKLSADWELKDLVTTVWYVRKSATAGQYDQLQLRREYERTAIYYRTTDHQQLQVFVAGAFAAAIESSDWKTAVLLCDEDLARQGPTKVRGMLRGLRPSSRAFVRKYMPNGNTAPIGINAGLELSENTFRSGEIGLDMSDDTFPLVKRIETSLP